MSNSASEEHDHGDGVEELGELREPPYQNPSAPPHESFDVSTTVDPSYVISLIRRLLPSDVNGLVREEPAAEGVIEDATNLPENGGEAEAMESSENHDKLEGRELSNGYKDEGGTVGERTWEECGCILWDLAASEDHAQFMVQNLILEVLLASLAVSPSSRITEISLGIIGNLACHETARKCIASVNGMVGAIVEQLLIDDVPCLCEACRVLSLCLQGGEGIIWAEALQPEHILSRILWIAENALNPQLIERSVGLLMAILESQQEVATILVPPLLKLGLSSLLIKLLAFEMTKLKEDRTPERYSVLDLILRTIEELSTMDNCSEEICENKELLQLARELIDLPDKFEVASSCVTAAVLIANILTDATHFTSDLSQDLNFLKGLFDVFPFASEDTEAQTAIWSIISRILTVLQEREMTPAILNFLVSILASKLDLIEDELLAHPSDHEEQSTSDTSGAKLDARLVSMKRTFDILTYWKSSDDSIKNTSFAEGCCIKEEDVDKLLDLCRKASRFTTSL
ncbi:protein saal1 isoform X2 [Salvia hispanica]|uniref:protein saal1 isoform X2 n=1 Tax=Salvia hispanica TaxID=49212 RepID=UPI00200931C2|nr:protein saal1 isoform X2 [Salvia hispanica]